MCKYGHGRAGGHRGRGGGGGAGWISVDKSGAHAAAGTVPDTEVAPMIEER